MSVHAYTTRRSVGRLEDATAQCLKIERQLQSITATEDKSVHISPSHIGRGGAVRSVVCRLVRTLFHPVTSRIGIHAVDSNNRTSDIALENCKVRTVFVSSEISISIVNFLFS